MFEKAWSRSTQLLLIVAVIFLLLLSSTSPELSSASASTAAETENQTNSSSGYFMLVSTSPNRSNPVPLEGLTVSGDIFAFTSPDSGVQRVSFYLDDPNMSGTPRKVESTAPYDFAGGNVSKASPFKTTSVPDGLHTITAAIELTAGGTEVVHTTFIVANFGSALFFNPNSFFFALEEGSSDTKSATIETTDTSSTSFTVSDDAAWLSVSPASGTTPASLSIVVDATGLQAGTYTGTITGSATGYGSATLSVTLKVGGAALDQVHLAWVDDPATTLTVVWRTWDTSTPSTVEYRQQGSSDWQTASGALRPSGTDGALHEVTISSLAPSTSYEYRVMGDGGGWSRIFTTRTAPPLGPADFDAIYVADTGLVGRTDGLATGTQQVVDEIARLNPLLVLPGGDYAYYNTDKRYGSLDDTIDVWFNQMQPVASQSPMMPTYGNHEVLLGEGYQAWADRFPTPEGLDGRQNYSFDIGDVHFVSIFAVYNTIGLTDAQLQWLEQDILAAQAAGQRWIIPYFHVPPFADGTNHPSNLELRSQLGPLFERLGVKIVLASHDQAYERTFPLIDVPATNTPTSNSTTCYTLEDGVTWVKISPGGKLSNLNNSFSDFATEPPPAWTAFRDNTMHHFSRLVVSASGSIRLDTYGVKGDGTPPIIQDSFQYTTGNCPLELQFGLESLSFNLDVDSSSTQTTILDTSDATTTGFTLSDNADWLSVSSDSGVTPANITITADTSGLAPGKYTAQITASAPGYVSDLIPVTLTVLDPSGTGYELLKSSSSNRSNPVPLDGSTVSGNIYVFTGPDTDVVQVSFYLDDPNMTGQPVKVEGTAPYDFAGGTVRTARAFDTTSIANGQHTITAAIELVTGSTVTVHAHFLVNN